MRFFLALIISFQFVSAPVAAELGESRPFTVKDHLINGMARSYTQEFETLTRDLLQKVSKEGLKAVTDDKAILAKGDIRPVFKENTPGAWEYTSQGNKISFSLLDIQLGQMHINGKVLKYKNVSLNDVEKNAEKMLVLKKTSMIEFLFNKTIGIESAAACELVCAAVILVVAVAIIGTAVYQLMIKPEKMVKRLQEMKNKLDQDALACNEAKNDQGKYEKTFALASAISDRSAISSSTSSADALEYAMKKQLESGRKNEDCFQIMHEIGKKVKLDIPVPTEKQIQRRELLGGGLANEKVDVASAAFNLCSSYNNLGSCMENFVAAHVNDSDINSFKDVATPSHWRYQKKVGAGRQ